ENQHAHDEKEDEREQRLTIRACMRDDDAEDERPHPRSATLRDFVEAEERGFTPLRNHPRKERARECLRTAEHDSNRSGHRPRLRRRLKKSVSVNDNPSPAYK